MHKHLLYVQYAQTHEDAGTIYRGIMQTASSASYDQLTVVMAYATKTGCELLVEGFETAIKSWKQMKKRWLVSLDSGITEPDALVYLAELPNSVVRVPNREISSVELFGGPFRFHSKLYLFESHCDREKIALFSGSCNLTRSGLYFNAEQATAFILTPPISKRDRPFLLNLKKQRIIIERMFRSSSSLSDDLLEKYRLLWRPANLPRIERARIEHERCTNILGPDPVINSSEAFSLASAEAFWVKVTNKVIPNRGKDKPGNQIDLHCGSRVFFGFGVSAVPPNTVFGSVPIRFEGSTSKFSVRFGNNGMDKINLPPLETPRTYAAKTLLFTRNKDGVYDLTIGNSRLEKRWRKKSADQGTIYQMQSGRPYGVFSKWT